MGSALITQQDLCKHKRNIVDLEAKNNVKIIHRSFLCYPKRNEISTTVWYSSCARRSLTRQESASCLSLVIWMTTQSVEAAGGLSSCMEFILSNNKYIVEGIPNLCNECIQAKLHLSAKPYCPPHILGADYIYFTVHFACTDVSAMDMSSRKRRLLSLTIHSLARAIIRFFTLPL